MKTTTVNYEMKNMCKTDYFTIHIAGDYDTAAQTSREYAFMHGMCTQLSKVQYCYTGGLEDGITARFIAYPRFPKSNDELFTLVESFAKKLAEKLCQKSFTIEGKDNTMYYTSTDPLHEK